MDPRPVHVCAAHRPASSLPRIILASQLPFKAPWALSATSTAKTILSNQTVNKEVWTSLGRDLSDCEGPRGTLRRDFHGSSGEVSLRGKEKKRLWAYKRWGNRNWLLSTLCSHVQNKGVTLSLRHMRSVCAYFPINVVIQENGSLVQI